MTKNKKKKPLVQGLPEGFDPDGRNFRIYEGVNYETYWESPVRSRIDGFELGLIQRLLPDQGRRFIDLGGGYGRLVPSYINRYEQAVLFDGSLTLLRKAREKYKSRLLYIAGNIQHIPFRTGAFDGALLVRVIQHVHDLEGSFQELHRILCGRGSLVFSYHNKRNIRQILGSIFSRSQISPFDTSSKELSRALLSHHPKKVQTILQKSGFSAATDFGVGVLERLRFRYNQTSPSAPVHIALVRTLGSLKLAPWIISKTHAEGERALAKAGVLSELLQCPACAGALMFLGHEYSCPTCDLKYPVTDGIPDFRI